jgi:hypothetical protein
VPFNREFVGFYPHQSVVNAKVYGISLLVCVTPSSMIEVHYRNQYLTLQILRISHLNNIGP